MIIKPVEADHYEIPLPVVLTESTPGEIRHFAVGAVRVRCDDGAEGPGYACTAGKAGGFRASRALAVACSPRHPLRVREGGALAPRRPGHGVEPDWEKLEARRARR